MNYRLLPIAALLLLLTLSCEQSDTDRSARSQGRTLEYPATVYFHNSEGDTLHSIRVAVAETPEHRSTGLMDVHEMPENNGMLFIFDREEPQSFWMANTPLGLDIIFASSDGRIVRIHRNTSPYSDREVSSEQPSRYVVETHAGYTLRHDIQEGMFISFERNKEE
ncbi:MAG: DUF192 domain-containing protein [Balneolaceae bacterium]